MIKQTFNKDLMIKFFCPNCKRRTEVIKGVVMVICSCGCRMEREDSIIGGINYD